VFVVHLCACVSVCVCVCEREREPLEGVCVCVCVWLCVFCVYTSTDEPITMWCDIFRTLITMFKACTGGSSAGGDGGSSSGV